MKTVVLLLLFCLVEADDLYRNVQALEDRVITLEGQLKTSLGGQDAVFSDMTSRLSATEAKMEELQKLVVELQRNKDQQQTSLNLPTEEQDCLKRKLCDQHGFTLSNGLCYYISTERKTWEDSRQWCTDRNSDLIVIKSKEKQDFVASFNERVWLGLTDKETEGSFQWVDGTPVTRPWYWYPGEPHYESNKETNAETDCVEYYDGSESRFPNRGWNDIMCSVSKYWICERVVC